MAKKKEKAVAEKKTVTLEGDLKESRKTLWSLKNDLSQGKVKNVREIRKLKRHIARILTALNQKEK